MARSYDWAAPAKLFFWPAADGSEEEALYPTLDEALKAAGEGDSAHAWIVTRDGNILNPRLVEALREDLSLRRRPRPAGARSFFSWARAA